MTFDAYTFTRSPARVEADTKPEAVASSQVTRASGVGSPYSLVGWLGLATYGFGIGPVLDLWLR